MSYMRKTSFDTEELVSQAVLGSSKSWFPGNNEHWLSTSIFFVLLLNFYVGSEGTSYWFIPRPLIRLYELKFNVENAVVDRPKDLFAF